MASPEFKVVIVGGSVAGLSLANMLQANHIDFVVLEAHSEIAPQVGASIGILPHGYRILDQLGLHDEILRLSASVNTLTFRDQNAKLIFSHPVAKPFTLRHGYTLHFMERRHLLQILYDNIKDKSKILTGKRVESIQIERDYASAYTADGCAYTGDMVVGADGVHSQVRTEMWKIAKELRPAYFDAEEGKAPWCEYNCIFGISSSCPGINEGDSIDVLRGKASYLIVGGPDQKVFWFRFQKLPARLYGAQIPRYNNSDMRNAIQSAVDEQITPQATFASLARNQTGGAMTPLAEYVYDQWYCKRIICIGDSVHKVHPIGGHGGNAAIESAAVLTNLLVDALRRSPNRLNLHSIEQIGSELQKIRRDRSETIKKYSHQRQRIESLDMRFGKLMTSHIMPLVKEEILTFSFSRSVFRAERLQMLENPNSGSLIPYKDELLHNPRRRGLLQWGLILFYLSCSVTVFFRMCIQSRSWKIAEYANETLEMGVFPQDPTFNLKTTYSGIQSIDTALTFINCLFIPGFRGWEANYSNLQLYFFGQLVQPIAILTAEASRGRHLMTPLAFPLIWFLFFQVVGIGSILPIYLAIFTSISDTETYWWPYSRRVSLHHSKTFLPATLIGYVFPTLLALMQWRDAHVAQNMAALWQISPLLVPVLQALFASIYRRIFPTRPLNTIHDFSKDVQDLETLYLAVGILGALLHWHTIGKLLLSASLWSTFASNWSSTPSVIGEALHELFLADFWGFSIATYVWCVASVWDLRRVGRSTVDVFKAAILVLLANLAVGPGATQAAVWYWREGAMAQTNFKKEKFT